MLKTVFKSILCWVRTRGLSRCQTICHLALAFAVATSAQAQSASFTLGAGGSYAAIPTAKIFLMDVDNIGTPERCTATLLDINRSYHLISNAHCFDGPLLITVHVPTSVSSHLGEWFGQANHAHDYSLRLKNLDRTRDLAELEMTPAFMQEFARADQVAPAQAITPEPNLSDSYASLGFHDGRPQVAFTRGNVWPSYGMSEVSATPTSLSNIDFLYNVEHHQISRGFSGGPTIDENHQLLGISLRFLAFVESTEVIPLASVQAFLDAPAWSGADARDLTQGEYDSASWVDAGENSGTHGGENSGAHGGENSGAHGGENSGAHGGQPMPRAQGPRDPAHEAIVPGGTHGDLQKHNPPAKPIDPTDILQPFRERDEGIDIQTAQGVQRLLAVGDTKAAYQIDGWDDKLRRNPLLNQKHSFELYRGTNLFSKAQRSIFKRFRGFYVDSTFSSGVKIYKRDDPRGVFEPYLEGYPTMSAEFTGKDSSQLTMRLGVANYSLERSTEEGRNNVLNLFTGGGVVSQQPEAATFVFTLSPDAQTISLRSQSGATLQCQNQDFLKLICTSRAPLRAEDLSVSLNAINDASIEKLTFHHALYTTLTIQGQTSEAIIFRYGIMRRNQ